MCLFVLFCFYWETGLFVLYFCLMNNCSDGSDEVSFFSFFPAGFSNLMEIYRRFIVTKIPKWFLSYSSQRVVNFVFGVLCCCALTNFFSSCTMYLKMFFFSSSIPELPKTEVQYSKPEMTYMTFLQMNSSAGLRSDSEFI